MPQRVRNHFSTHLIYSLPTLCVLCARPRNPKGTKITVSTRTEPTAYEQESANATSLTHIGVPKTSKTPLEKGDKK